MTLVRRGDSMDFFSSGMGSPAKRKPSVIPPLTTWFDDKEIELMETPKRIETMPDELATPKIPKSHLVTGMKSSAMISGQMYFAMKP